MHSDTIKFYKYKPVDKPQFSDRFCPVPFTTMQIDNDGDVQLCSCQLHMPYTIGNVYQTSLKEIWFNEAAEQVRQAVNDGKFTYCSWDCATLYNLPKKRSANPLQVQKIPFRVKIDLDRSCNLKCPSCREDVIIEKKSDRIQKQIEIYQEIKQWAMDNPDDPFNIIPCASGEIFASHSGLKFLESVAGSNIKNLQISITSNGTLLHRNRDLVLALKNNIKTFSISIDAATPETYADVRGGDWNQLMLGLDMIKEELGHIPLGINFVIQKENFHEIVPFAELAEHYNAMVRYAALLDWGHWTIDWWKQHAVVKQGADELKTILDDIQKVKSRSSKHVGLSADLIKLLQKAGKLSN